MKKTDSLDKAIKNDCRKAMLPSTLIYAVQESVTALLHVAMAGVLGEFADAVFRLDVSYGMTNLWKLLICLGIRILILPLFDSAGGVLMLSNALKHDQFVLERYMNKSWQDAMRIDEGESQGRLEDDPIEMRGIWTDIVVKYITVPVTSLFLFSRILRVDWRFTIIAVFVYAIKIILPFIARRRNAKYDKEDREYRTKIRDYESEITAKPHTVKILGLSDALIGRIDTAFQEYYKQTFCKSIRYKTELKSINDFLNTFCFILLSAAGCAMIVLGYISTGVVIAMFGYFPVIDTIIGDISSIVSNVPIYHNVVERMRVHYQGGEREDGENIGEMTEISINRVSLSYDGIDDALHETSFKINKGDKIAVKGMNGAGKTTFLRVLCGLLPDYKGEILLDGKDLRRYSISSWRQLISYAPQKPYLFEGNVRENICIGNMDADNGTIESVMKTLGIQYLADRTIEIDQEELSGGEKQKISIARALLKDAPVLLLDEPTNNLDSQSIKWLMQYIQKCNKTILMISHYDDLSFVSNKTINI